MKTHFKFLSAAYSPENTVIKNTTHQDKIIKPPQLFRQAAHLVATGYNLNIIFI